MAGEPGRRESAENRAEEEEDTVASFPLPRVGCGTVTQPRPSPVLATPTPLPPTTPPAFSISRPPAVALVLTAINLSFSGLEGGVTAFVPFSRALSSASQLDRSTRIRELALGLKSSPPEMDLRFLRLTFRLRGGATDAAAAVGSGTTGCRQSPTGLGCEVR